MEAAIDRMLSAVTFEAKRDALILLMKFDGYKDHVDVLRTSAVRCKPCEPTALTVSEEDVRTALNGGDPIVVYALITRNMPLMDEVIAFILDCENVELGYFLLHKLTVYKDNQQDLRDHARVVPRTLNSALNGATDRERCAARFALYYLSVPDISVVLQSPNKCNAIALLYELTRHGRCYSAAVRQYAEDAATDDVTMSDGFRVLNNFAGKFDVYTPHLLNVAVNAVHFRVDPRNDALHLLCYFSAAYYAECVAIPAMLEIAGKSAANADDIRTSAAGWTILRNLVCFVCVACEACEC